MDAAELAANLANLKIKPFLPGQSGNIGGRPRKYHEVLRLAQGVC
jgi:hypothetical protein